MIRGFLYVSIRFYTLGSLHEIFFEHESHEFNEYFLAHGSHSRILYTRFFFEHESHEFNEYFLAHGSHESHGFFSLRLIATMESLEF